MSEKSIEVTGGIFGAIIAASVKSWQLIVVLLFLYGLFLLGNLLTGIAYAKQQNEYDEAVAHQAFWRKFGMTMGILIMFIGDLIIVGLASCYGIHYSMPFLSCILAGYAFVHELISMIGNIKKLGNKVPAVIDSAINKAEEALDQGKIPDFTNILKGNDLK